jgi:hypothetical protein
MLPNAYSDVHATSCIASNQALAAKQLTGHKNPSAHRRFLPASSTNARSAQSKSNTPAADHSANRFPKRTPVGPSTSFANTPSVRGPRDEIEAGFDGSGSSSPVLPTRLRFSSSFPRQRDAIDDASDEDDDARAAGKPEDLAYDDEDDLGDLLFLEKLRKTKAPESAGGQHNVHGLESMPRKRPRTSRIDPTMEDIAMSSSPSPEPAYSAHVSDTQDYYVGFSIAESVEDIEAPVATSDEDFTSSPTGPTSTFASSKFRKPKPSSLFSMPAPSTRLAFKTPQVQTAATMEQSATSSLPDAFSPSRRRGKKDYMLGGAADAVRSWVLAFAPDEPKAGQTYTERFKVAETTDDYPEGKCLLVTGENGRRWLLINESAKAGGRGSDTTARKVRIGCSVGIRASSPAVNLQLDCPVQLNESSCDETRTITSEWSVGILWDVLD